jgi:hypothetical protein
MADGQLAGRLNGAIQNIVAQLLTGAAVVVVSDHRSTVLSRRSGRGVIHSEVATLTSSGLKANRRTGIEHRSPEN